MSKRLFYTLDEIADHYHSVLGFVDVEHHREVVREFLAKPGNVRRRNLNSLAPKTRRHQRAIRLLQAITLDHERRADYCWRTGLDQAKATRLLNHLYAKEPKLRDAIHALSADSTGTSEHFRQQQKPACYIRGHARVHHERIEYVFKPDGEDLRVGPRRLIRVCGRWINTDPLLLRQNRRRLRDVVGPFWSYRHLGRSPWSRQTMSSTAAYAEIMYGEPFEDRARRKRSYQFSWRHDRCRSCFFGRIECLAGFYVSTAIQCPSDIKSPSLQPSGFADEMPARAFAVTTETDLEV
jgi:hypothetical protein